MRLQCYAVRRRLVSFRIDSYWHQKDIGQGIQRVDDIEERCHGRDADAVC